MHTENFYNIVDEQLKPIIEDNRHNKYFDKKDDAGKKSFALLLWFIQKYNPELENIADNVTDGADDSSCDIIFSNNDNFGVPIYYVVQAKWNTEKNIKGHKGISKEIKACLSDFALILDGQKSKSTINKKFNTQYQNLLKHIESGGQVKFVFLCLCKLIHDAHANVRNFITDLVQFEEMDIDRLKRDYIEMEYKGARTHNPIEHPYEPKGEITLVVEQKNIIDVKKPYKSYIFLVRPQLLNDLFKKYGFALFYKNIRNPLPDSNYNYSIASTIRQNPEKFWYFNNGITAITEKIQKFHETNVNIKVHGLQIINGAQTVFTIHDAYNSANDTEKKRMNDALIALRVVESNDQEFDEDITRFTNSQNPVSDRDFRSNDDTQKRLQNYFFDNTNIWYERRRGEFRYDFRKAERVSNETFAHAYLAFYLQRPVDAKQKRAQFFKLNKEGGFYNDIFNENTKYSDMLSAYCINVFVENKMKDYKRKFNAIVLSKKGGYLKKDIPLVENQFILHATSHILALLRKHLYKQYRSGEFNSKIYIEYQTEQYQKWEKSYDVVIKKLRDHIRKVGEDPTFSLTKYFKSSEDETIILNLM